MKRQQLSGEIVGRRAWRIGNFDPVTRQRESTLLAIVQHAPWAPGVNTATCIVNRPHDAPAHACACGLYAYYDADPHLRFCERGTIHGIITAWGDVELHPDGFRAQSARVAALVMDGENHDHWDALARRYGARLITPTQFLNDAFISEFGEVVPTSMRPKPGRRSKRDNGARAITALVMLGALCAVIARSVVPIMVVVWIVVAMTLSTMRWPEWWDA